MDTYIYTQRSFGGCSTFLNNLSPPFIDRRHYREFLGVCAPYVRVPPNHRQYHYRCHFSGFPDKMGECVPYVRLPTMSWVATLHGVHAQTTVGEEGG